jgi:hypothetical protein
VPIAAGWGKACLAAFAAECGAVVSGHNQGSGPKERFRKRPAVKGALTIPG